MGRRSALRKKSKALTTELASSDVTPSAIANELNQLGHTTRDNKPITRDHIRRYIASSKDEDNTPAPPSDEGETTPITPITPSEVSGGQRGENVEVVPIHRSRIPLPRTGRDPQLIREDLVDTALTIIRTELAAVQDASKTGTLRCELCGLTNTRRLSALTKALRAGGQLLRDAETAEDRGVSLSLSRIQVDHRIQPREPPPSVSISVPEKTTRPLLNAEIVAAIKVYLEELGGSWDELIERMGEQE